MKFKATIFIFLFPLFMMSQEKASVDYNNLPLSQVFIDIEKKFDVKLSFKSELINNLFITFQQSDATLQEVFIAIEDQANIEFSKVK